MSHDMANLLGVSTIGSRCDGGREEEGLIRNSGMTSVMFCQFLMLYKGNNLPFL